MSGKLLVFNGAEYSLQAIKQAAWMAKAENARLDVLYANPSCNEIYPDIPGLCFWMPEREYKVVAERLRKQVLDGKVKPVFEEVGITPKIMVTSDNQDDKIREMSESGKYDEIFIASPSKYCREPGGLLRRFGRGQNEIPPGAVCLV